MQRRFYNEKRGWKVETLLTELSYSRPEGSQLFKLLPNINCAPLQIQVCPRDHYFDTAKQTNNEGKKSCWKWTNTFFKNAIEPMRSKQTHRNLNMQTNRHSCKQVGTIE